MMFTITWKTVLGIVAEPGDLIAECAHDIVEQHASPRNHHLRSIEFVQRISIAHDVALLVDDREVCGVFRFVRGSFRRGRSIAHSTAGRCAREACMLRLDGTRQPASVIFAGEQIDRHGKESWIGGILASVLEGTAHGFDHGMPLFGGALHTQPRRKSLKDVEHFDQRNSTTRGWRH